MNNISKKKKGFTLIELIAVIAILAILAAILVPRIGNYRERAVISSAEADARTVLDAVELYNADNDVSTPADKFDDIPEADRSKYLGSIDPDLSALTTEQLTNVSEGKSASGTGELEITEAKTYTDNNTNTP